MPFGLLCQRQAFCLLCRSNRKTASVADFDARVKAGEKLTVAFGAEVVPAERLEARKAFASG